MLTENELVYFAIYLEKFGWANPEYYLETNLNLIALTTKIYLNNTDSNSVLIEYLKLTEPSLEKQHHTFLKQKKAIGNSLNVTPREANEKHKQLLKPFNVYCKQNYLDLNFVVDEILNMSIPYSETRRERNNSEEQSNNNTSICGVSTNAANAKGNKKNNMIGRKIKKSIEDEESYTMRANNNVFKSPFNNSLHGINGLNPVSNNINSFIVNNINTYPNISKDNMGFNDFNTIYNKLNNYNSQDYNKIGSFTSVNNNNNNLALNNTSPIQNQIGLNHDKNNFSQDNIEKIQHDLLNKKNSYNNLQLELLKSFPAGNNSFTDNNGLMFTGKNDSFMNIGKLTQNNSFNNLGKEYSVGMQAFSKIIYNTKIKYLNKYRK